MTRILILAFLFGQVTLDGQTNVRAWYADGQVWIVWDLALPLPETVGVYADNDPFTDTNDATLIGRPFHLDYIPIALREQVDSSATYRIPNGQGGIYKLDLAEGLFVYTPHESGSMYFAVVPYGENVIMPGVNITDTSIPFNYNPQSDPVECHLQASFPSPFSPAGYFCFAYYMWVDGREDHLDRRPDFPVMANAAKNGMAGFFFISAPVDLDTTKSFPLTIWLHGGGGTARQSLAGSRPQVNINPEQGILVAHNDDVFGRRGSSPAYIENPSLHFGWRENWDPFTTDNIPTSPDTIINYTQRRYLWIDQWLIRKFNIDPKRIHIQGHSMGSWGATGLIKAYPEHYASAVIFNNGFRGHEPETNIAAMLGEPSAHFPTNLRNRNGETVRYPEIFDIITNTSKHRDLPFLRSFHSKNDTGNANYWGVEVIDNYRIADSLGHGMALYWSEREHGIDTGPDHDDHWVNGNSSALQTATDDVRWGEAHYRSDISYPAFYNHRLGPSANDPGDGTPGTGAQGVGDDWGTWGGWHRWDVLNIIDEQNTWSVEAWLESNAVFDHDECPHQQLTADLAIRRPVNFTPHTGDMIEWKSEDASTGTLLQSGTAIVADDDLVKIPSIQLWPEDIRRTRITITSLPLNTITANNNPNHFMIYPNPVVNQFTIRIPDTISGQCTIRLFSMDSRLQSVFTINLESQMKEIGLSLDEQLSSGIYVVMVQTEEGSKQLMMMKK